MSLNRTHLLAALCLVAGLMIGGAGATIAFRHRWIGYPGESAIDRMARLIHLTPAEYDEVNKIMIDTRDKVELLKRDFQRERRVQVLAALTQIRGLLDPAQQAQFDRYFAPPATPSADAAQATEPPVANASSK
jgi:hypothetical protein